MHSNMLLLKQNLIDLEAKIKEKVSPVHLKAQGTTKAIGTTQFGNSTVDRHHIQNMSLQLHSNIVNTNQLDRAQEDLISYLTKVENRLTEDYSVEQKRLIDKFNKLEEMY